MEKFVGKISFSSFVYRFSNRSRTIAKEISSSGAADSKRRQSGDTRPSRDFTTMQTKDFFLVSFYSPDVSVCVLFPPLPVISRPSVSFFREERRRPGGELWPNVRLDGVKASFGQLQPFFAAIFLRILRVGPFMIQISILTFNRAIFIISIFYDSSRANFIIASARKFLSCRFPRFLNFLGDVLKVFEIARVIFDFQLKFKWGLIWIQILV